MQCPLRSVKCIQSQSDPIEYAVFPHSDSKSRAEGPSTNHSDRRNSGRKDGVAVKRRSSQNLGSNARKFEKTDIGQFDQNPFGKIEEIKEQKQSQKHKGRSFKKELQKTIFFEICKIDQIQQNQQIHEICKIRKKRKSDRALKRKGPEINKGLFSSILVLSAKRTAEHFIL